jgi:selenocysteine-specific elongation factor
MSQPRRNIMLGTAGHVDHGKSALVKLLTGCETDTLAEEKQRGLTIDLGFAPCRLADQRVVGVVDVPGHVDFIRNMVAGAHGIDVVIFVVAADDGIMPQTVEHLHILELMGLRHGVVALTKRDLVDETRLGQVRQDLGRLLAGTFLADAPVCPISNLNGAGFEDFFEALNRTVDQCGDRSSAGLFRLWVEDSFAIRGAGTVVTGIPTHGRIRAGAQLQLWPGGLAGRVRRMQVYGEDATEAGAGECVALNLPELVHEAVGRGMMLVESGELEPVTMAEAELQILGTIPGKIEDYLEVQLHVGTAAVSAHLAMLEQTEMTGGEKQLVQLRLGAPLLLAPGERFVVRANVAGAGIAGLTTIGGGQILGLSNVRLRRRKPWTLSLLAARRAAVNEPTLWCEQMLREADSPVTAVVLRRKCWRRAEEIQAMLAELSAGNRVLRAGSGGWLHRDAAQECAESILAAVERYHAGNPQHGGVSLETLRAELKADPELVGLAAGLLLDSKRLERSGDLLARPGWRAQLPDRDRQLCDQFAAKLQQAGWTPPGREELAAALGEPPGRIETLAKLLVERGAAVRLGDGVWMHRDAVEAGKQTALKLFGRAPAFLTMEFRDALGVSRKYAVPLLDHLDAIRFTVRSGNQRTPGAEAKKLLKPVVEVNHLCEN